MIILLNAKITHIPVTEAAHENAMSPFTPPAAPAARGMIIDITNRGTRPLREVIRFPGSYESPSLVSST